MMRVPRWMMKVERSHSGQHTSIDSGNSVRSGDEGWRAHLTQCE